MVINGLSGAELGCKNVCFPPNRGVQGRCLLCPQYVDSGRLRPNNAPMPMPARRWMQAQATRHPAV